MHMPRPLFELRHFVFVLQHKFIKAFNSDMNDRRGLQSISIALFCFLEDIAEAPNNNNICTMCSNSFRCTTSTA